MNRQVFEKAPKLRMGGRDLNPHNGVQISIIFSRKFFTPTIGCQGSDSEQPRTVLHDKNDSTYISNSKLEESLGKVYYTGNMPSIWLLGFMNLGPNHVL